MKKQGYLILGIVLILLIAGAVFGWEKTTPAPTPVTPTPPTPTPETRQPENSPNTQTPKPPEGWKTYENKEFGFAFDYPSIWGLNPDEQEESFGKSLFMQLGWPKIDFPITAYNGLTIEEVEEKIKERFDSDLIIESKIEKESLSGLNKGFKLIVRWRTNVNVEGTHEYLVLLHPYKKIAIEVGLFEPTDLLQKQVVDSFRFFP